MSIDEKTIAEIAGQLGISANKGDAEAKIKAFEHKSDGELLTEIIKMRGKLQAKGIPYDKQIEMVKKLMPMMNREQRARLQNVIELLGR